MKKMICRILAVTSALLLACTSLAEEDLIIEEFTEIVSEDQQAGSSMAPGEDELNVAEDEKSVLENAPSAENGMTVTEDGWTLSPEGFLRGNNPGEKYMLEDPENGFWQYASADLAITVRQYTEEVTSGKKKRKLEYCIADIHASEASPLTPVMTEASKKRIAGYKQVSPETLIEKHPAVFAMSDDMYGIRFVRNFNFKGIVVRNGEILSGKTRNSKKSRPWPNLDVLALYPDGSMKTFICDELSAEEYLSQGATQVFSFGPVLIRDGAITEQVLDPKYYPYNEPRVAIGMVEPWHYIAIVVRGRPREQYAGVHLDWVAQKLLDHGCVEAMNLDGGETATMMFNGKVIEKGGNQLRSQGSMIVFGLQQDAE